MEKLDYEIKNIVGNILDDYGKGKTIDHVEIFAQPDAEIVKDMIAKLMKIVFPGFFREKTYRFYNMDSRLTVIIEDVVFNMNRQVAVALMQSDAFKDKTEEERLAAAEKISIEFFKKIPKIREYVETDVKAFYDGDPAAYNKNEIVLSYPGLYAITVNRIAHELHLLNVPLIPRMMTEYAHSKTGIDIHPGATLGKYFFIDHGTGIVVGETTIIGDHVKVYQGVTIGALSTRGGQNLKGVKRHPTIEDNVTIYSGASILGGETVIGEGTVIGSNAFITESLEPGSRVSVKNQELNIRNSEGKSVNQQNWFYII